MVEIMVKKRAGEAFMLLALALGLVAVFVPPNQLINGTAANGIGSSLIRVLCQGAVIGPTIAFYLLSSKSKRRPVIYHLPSLTLWGVSGAATVLLYFLAIEKVGYATASVLSSSSGILAFLMDRYGKRAMTKQGFLAVFCAFCGFIILGASQIKSGQQPSGWLYGIGSGVTACIAYMALARAPVRNSSICVLSSWFGAALLVHVLIMTETAAVFPSSKEGWLYPVGFGFLTTAVQWLTSKAFQIGPARHITRIANLAAPSVYICEWGFGGRSPTSWEWAALGLITAGSFAKTSTET